MNKEIFVKSFFTGILYAYITCIVQVPVAQLLFSFFHMQSDTSLTNEQIPALLLSIFLTGIAMAIFFYRNASIFSVSNKWIQGIQFALFIYLSNYIPQVFFLDACNGFFALVSGGFPMIQVELFDFIILFMTVLIMITYMPMQRSTKLSNEKNTGSWWKTLLCGLLFALILTLLQEWMFPFLGIQSIAASLQVQKEHLLFFYSVMFIGFMLAGCLVSHYAFCLKGKRYFCLEYGVWIWCAFDLTMIPLGFGLTSTLTFMISSMIAFVTIEYLTNQLSK